LTASGLILSLSFTMLLTACSSRDGGTGQTGTKVEAPSKADTAAQISKDPVTIKILVRIGLADSDFDKYFVQPVKKKYPHLTLERVELPKGVKLEDWVTAGSVPDIILQGANVAEAFGLKIPLGLNTFIKQQNIDLKLFDAPLMETIKLYGDKKDLYASPFAANTQVLFYNKGIFDRFGVGYPKDGMTWDDSIELAKQVTRMDGGVQYRGLDPLPGSITGMASSLSLPLFDPQTNKAVVSEQWKTVFDTAMSAYGISGNKPAELKSWASRDYFLKDKQLAMTVDYINFMFAQFKNAGDVIDWDMAQPPSFKTAPNRTNQTDFHQFFISSTSKYPAQALQVIMAATSDEVQLELAKKGTLPVLANAQIRSQFGTELPFKSKRMEAIFKSQAAVKQFSDYDAIVEKAISNAFTELFTGATDTNTALRKAQEAAAIGVEQELKKK
jgi:multiple sugar transport system substrate-binding protein